MISLISLYFMIRSLVVVELREGEALTSMSHGFKLGGRSSIQKSSENDIN